MDRNRLCVCDRAWNRISSQPELQVFGFIHPNGRICRNKAKENNVVKQTSDETNNDEIQPVKKRRGRPRKSDITITNNTEVNSENNKETEVTNNSNVKIYDYSDRAIAIYGDYKDILPIKDKLKEIGCRYNKFLNINGVKTPGWIVSAKKRAEVEKIINNS